MTCCMIRVRCGRPNPGWRWAANNHRSDPVVIKVVYLESIIFKEVLHAFQDL
jgi:hypothetical protein